MKCYILRRIFLVIPIALIISMLIFILTSMAPGDPARIRAEQTFNHPSTAQIELVREQMHLNDPLYTQYFRWLSNVLKGDFGTSYVNGKPVLSELMTRLPATLQLGITAVLVLICLAFPLGILSAVYQNSMLDTLIQILSFFSVSMPSFWIGLMFLYIFGVKFHVISVIGMNQDKLPLLPAIAMAFGYTGILTRLIRTNMILVLNQSFIKAIRARGIPAPRILLRHGMKNIMVPVLTRLSGMIIALLSGSAIIETIFSIQGIGNFSLTAVMNKDIPVMQCYFVIMTTVIVLANLLVDIAYTILDKRIRYS